MPTYTFRDNNTGEQFEKVMKIAEREEYLQQNPHIESIIVSAPAFSGDRIVLKTDNGFKEVLQKIHQKTPGSILNRTTKI
jgi:hypothetical protein